MKSKNMSELFGRVILERKNEWMNRLKGYKVEINGTAQEKKIMNGNSEEYEVPGGTNTIACKVNWCGSNTYSFDVKPGETVYLKVTSGMKYFWFTYAVLMVLLLGRTFFKQLLTPQLNIVFIAVSIFVLAYFLFYLTIGRNKYLVIKEDKDNIFAK